MSTRKKSSSRRNGSGQISTLRPQSRSSSNSRRPKSESRKDEKSQQEWDKIKNQNIAAYILQRTGVYIFVVAIISFVALFFLVDELRFLTIANSSTLIFPNLDQDVLLIQFYYIFTIAFFVFWFIARERSRNREKISPERIFFEIIGIVVNFIVIRLIQIVFVSVVVAQSAAFNVTIFFIITGWGEEIFYRCTLVLGISSIIFYIKKDARPVTQYIVLMLLSVITSFIFMITHVNVYPWSGPEATDLTRIKLIVTGLSGLAYCVFLIFWTKRIEGLFIDHAVNNILSVQSIIAII